MTSRITSARAEQAVRKILKAGALPMILGGDHAIPIPVLRAFEGRGPITLVQIDAHIDWRDDFNGVRDGLSSPIRRASEMEHIKDIFQIGIRAQGSARPEEVEAAKAYGANIVTACELHDVGMDAILDRIPDGGQYYITIDADGMDPAVMPAVAGPAPGGVTFHQARKLIHGLVKKGRVVGMDIVEITPALDVNRISSVTAGAALRQPDRGDDRRPAISSGEAAVSETYKAETAKAESYKALGLSCFGPASFLKAPVVAPEAPWSADVAFLGVPFDLGTGFRSGTRWGPKAIRDMSVRFSALSAPGNRGFYDLRTGRDRAKCSFVDCGDVEIVPLLWEQDFALITAAMETILGRGALPLVAGGDHAVSFPILRAYRGRGPITVVHFDAHLDYRDEAMGVRYGHGNVLRRVRESPT